MGALQKLYAENRNQNWIQRQLLHLLFEKCMSVCSSVYVSKNVYGGSNDKETISHVNIARLILGVVNSATVSCELLRISV